MKLKDFCEKRNIAFASGITTNGSLLSDDVILTLKSCDINYYQITIDGSKEEHDKVKNNILNISSFDLILNNIVRTLALNPQAHITLRINYTQKILGSEHIIDDLANSIPSELRNRIEIDPQRVWQIKEDSINMTDLYQLYEKISDAGFRFNTDHVFAICYVDKVHYNMIYYNGGVDKCDHRHLSSLRGSIDNDGRIIWTEKPRFLSYGVLSPNSECSSCYYYPICYCGCPIRREDTICTNGRITCGMEKDEGWARNIFACRIQDFCWRTLLNQGIKL